MKCIGSNIKKLIGSIITDKATENVKIMTYIFIVIVLSRIKKGLRLHIIQKIKNVQNETNIYCLSIYWAVFHIILCNVNKFS